MPSSLAKLSGYARGMTPSPTPSPSPSPIDGSWLTIHGPLVVVPDGGWDTLISLLALLISLVAVWFTFSARPLARAAVVRWYVSESDPHDQNPVKTHDGDEVTVLNIGRAPMILKDIRVITADGKRRRTDEGKRGPDGKRVPFPALPASVPSGDVLSAWFPSSLAGETSGVKHGYEITTLRPGGFFRRSTREAKIVVKVSEADST